MAVATATNDEAPATGVRLGLRANLAQFSLLVAVNALVGGTIGQERTVLPLLGEREFGLTAYTAGLTFIVAFGITKALTNLVAGTLADRVGRKPVLVAGWVVGIPVPLMLIWAPSWGWVVAANILLGINQGLTWSTTVIMKIDLAGPQRRGLAMGLNEAAGYGALAATAAATGWIATSHGLRPEPFLLGAAYIAIGLGLSAVFVRETRGHAQHEAANHTTPAPSLTLRQVLVEAAWRDRSLLAINQAGLVNNLNDGVAWGLLPILFAADGLSVTEVGVLAASTRPCGPSASSSPARSPTAPAASPSSWPACSSRQRPSPGSPRRPERPLGRSLRLRSGSVPRSSTRPCSPPSVMSPTPAGGRPPSASTGCGATAATPSAP
jgi:MFS family permease